MPRRVGVRRRIALWKRELFAAVREFNQVVEEKRREVVCPD